jgi:hypothetical protein
MLPFVSIRTPDPGMGHDHGMHGEEHGTRPRPKPKKK